VVGDDEPTRMVLRDGARRTGPSAAGAEPGRGRSGPPAVTARTMAVPGVADLREWLAARWPSTEVGRLKLMVAGLGVLLAISLIVVLALAL
jgi:hypothetical protein